MDISKQYLFIGPKILTRGGPRPIRVGRFSVAQSSINTPYELMPGIKAYRNVLTVSEALVVNALWTKAVKRYRDWDPTGQFTGNNNCGVGLASPSYSIYFEDVNFHPYLLEGDKSSYIAQWTGSFASVSRVFKPRLP